MRARRMQAQLTELDGHKLARGAEDGTRRVLRSEAEARAAAERVAAAALAVKAASRKVPSLFRSHVRKCAPSMVLYNLAMQLVRVSIAILTCRTIS